MPYDLSGSTVNEISKVISFYFKHGRYPKKSCVHSHVVAVSQAINQLEIDARLLKTTIRILKGKTGNEFSKAILESPLADNPKAGAVLADLFTRHTKPRTFSQSQQAKSIEDLISATQVLIDAPHYSNDYGYDKSKSAKE